MGNTPLELTHPVREIITAAKQMYFITLISYIFIFLFIQMVMLVCWVIVHHPTIRFFMLYFQRVLSV